jgi:predicted phosphodiesterase
MRFASFLLCSLLLRAAGPFIAEPYLQLGDARELQKSETMALLWQTPDEKADWSVELKLPLGKIRTPIWKKTAPPVSRRVAVDGIEPHLVWRATLTGLTPGAQFDYRVLQGGKQVFEGKGRARKAAGQAFRFVAFGDSGAGTPSEKAIAKLALQQDPDFVLIPGDIVYTRGRIAEYREKFFPYYNSDEIPLMRSVLFVGAPGNHDTLGRNLSTAPDSLAYYYYWAQPLNGPMHSSFGALSGPDAAQSAFRDAAGDNFPRMSNFSFDYGNSHWLILDTNPYADWTDARLRRWIADDLAATKATWKFVGFHHPGFNSSKAHRDEQQARVLSDVFEAGGVDVVIAGHVHNYQRTYPLTFQADKVSFPLKQVSGKWTLDKSYDGAQNTQPKGIIYLVTGAGGAELYDQAQTDDPSSWLEFTAKFQSKVHSLTSAEIDGRTAKFRQISESGDVLDSFTITK